MDTQALAKSLIVLGVVLFVAGVFLYFGGRLNFLGLGRLPGDIRIERPGFQLYFPIVTCVVVSAVLTILFYVISRFR